MRLISLVFALLLLLVGPAAAHAPSYTDGTGTGITYGLGFQRIVSLAPNVTEMLFFLGLGDKVVGRSQYCNFPPAVAALPSVGGFTDTSLEKVVALKPDLVIAYQGNSRELIAQLRQLKIKVLAFEEAKGVLPIGQQMQELYRITDDGTHDYPDELDKWIQQVLPSSFTPTKEKSTVFYGMPGEITYTAAPGSFIDDLITRAGGRNVVPKGKERWPQVGAEFILAAQPDWLLVSTPCTGHTELDKASKDIRSSLAKDPVWRKLKAVQQNRIVVINADVLLRPGPRILDALEQLQSAIGGGK